MRLDVGRLVVALALAIPAAAAAQGSEQTLYVSVLDKDDHPVQGLNVPDFTVREDGISREVLRAGRTADPIDLAIVVDNSQLVQPYVNDLRKALDAFVTRMADQQAASIAVLGMADRPTILCDYTTSVGELTKGVKKIFAQPGAGTVFQDTLTDTTKGLRARDNPRRAIVVITSEGTDFSNVPYERTLQALNESGASLHVLVITTGSGAAVRDQHARERGIVIDQGTRDTGGNRQDLLSSMALAGALQQVADDLAQQYKVVYSRPGTLIPPKKVEASVKRDDVKTHATLVRPKPGA